MIPRSTIERRLAQLFLLGLALVVGAVGLELIYRALPHKNRQGAFYFAQRESSHVPKPYVMFVAEPNATDPDPANLINKLGYRGALPSKVKPPGEYRIFFLGGSALFWGRPQIPVIFEELLHQRGMSGVRVFNFGIPSSVTRQELVRTLLDISGYQPDLIVSYSGYNDLYDTGWDPRINYPHRFVLFEINPALTHDVRDYDWPRVLGFGSQIVRDFFPDWLVMGLVRKLLPQNAPSRDELRPLIAKAYVQNLRLTRQLSTDLGADFASFLQPTVFFKTPLDASEKQLFTEQDLTRARKIRSTVLEAVRPFEQELAFHDLNDVLANEPRPAFKDYVHFQDEVRWPYQKMAEVLRDQLEGTIQRGMAAGNQRPRPALTDLVPEEDFE